MISNLQSANILRRKLHIYELTSMIIYIKYFSSVTTQTFSLSPITSNNSIKATPRELNPSEDNNMSNNSLKINVDKENENSDINNNASSI